MSADSNNPNAPRPDYTTAATEVGTVYSANKRETGDPDAGHEAAPLWVMVLAGIFALFGLIYFVLYSGGCSIDRSNPFRAYAATDIRPQDGAGMANLSPFDKAMKDGKKAYGSCAGCHGATGEGAPGQFPPLNESEWVTGNTEPLAMIILKAVTGPIEVKGVPWDVPGGMNFDGTILSDEKIASIMTYIRNSFGNEASMVTPEMIATARAKHAAHPTKFTVADLKAHDNMLPGEIPSEEPPVAAEAAAE